VVTQAGLEEFATIGRRGYTQRTRNPDNLQATQTKYKAEEPWTRDLNNKKRGWERSPTTRTYRDKFGEARRYVGEKRPKTSQR